SDSQVSAGALERSLRSSFTGIRARDQISEPQRSVEPASISLTAVEFDRTRRRCVSFPAAEIAARARLAAGHDRHVAKLARGVSRAPKNFAVYNQPDTDARARPHQNKVAGGSRCTASATTLCFIDRSRSRIILDEHRHFQPEHLRNRNVLPSLVRRVQES